MASSKPRVIMSFKDELYGVCQTFIDVVEEHFEIVWSADFKRDSKAHENVIGIICWDGMKNLEVYDSKQIYGRNPAAVKYFLLLKSPVPKQWMDALPNLKIVAVCGTGYDHIDVKMVRSYGVKVSNTPNILNTAVAELGMTLILAGGRDLVNYVNLCKEISLSNAPNFLINKRSLEPSGSTLGIVGMGRIGYIVAKRALAFDMKILYHNRNKRPDDASVNATYYSSLNEMIPLCDYILICICLTPETEKLFGEEQFNLMKKSAILINISRGGTVDQDALVSALKNNKIRQAMLDVTTPEPLPRDHELLKLPNVVITPHIGSQTKSTSLKMFLLTVENVLAALKGNPLPSEVTG